MAESDFQPILTSIKANQRSERQCAEVRDFLFFCYWLF
jgi:hypothetical protein